MIKMTLNKLTNNNLHNFKFLFTSILLTLSLNVGSSDTQTFSKDAYLDLRNLCFALAERIGIFIGFLVNATFDIADGLVFKLTFNTGGNFITKLAGVVLSLNVGSSDTQTFSKDAYLDLSKPYTYNWNNSPNYTKKDNQANKLLKQVGFLEVILRIEISVLPLPKELAYSLAFWLMRLSTLLMAWFLN
jgi:hypothetical protein